MVLQWSQTVISQVAHLKISEPSEYKFTTFSIIALAVLQKNFISNFNAITFQMPKVITVLLSFLCLFNVCYLQLKSSFLRSCRLQKCIEHIFTKGSSKFGRSPVLFFMSIAKTAFLLYKSSSGNTLWTRAWWRDEQKAHLH